ncbi:S24 family peptidase [Acinetobacter soli]|uniref:S24 family peptidase n=1 Tax=Acinetobacter soli TaxID=487316 RepID=UPI00321889A5
MTPKSLLKVDNTLRKIELVQLNFDCKLLPMVENGKMPKVQSAKYQDFASRLKDLMQKKESPIKTVTQLKDAIDVTYEMARRYTLGTAKPREEKMKVLAEKFKVDISYLDHGTTHKIFNNCNLEGTWIPIHSYSKISKDGYFQAIESSNITIEGYIPFSFASSESFAICATGGVLHPAIKDGWFLICDPQAPLINGEYVLVSLKDDRKVIKELISINNNLYIFQDLNNGERISFEKKEIESILAIIGISPPSRFKENPP